MKHTYLLPLATTLLLVDLTAFSQGEIINNGRRSPWWTVANSGTTNPAVHATYGTSIIAGTENFAGTLDAQNFVLSSNNLSGWA